MADIVINSGTHTHTWNRPDPNGSQSQIPISEVWALCAAGHTDCKHNTTSTDTFLKGMITVATTPASGQQTGAGDIVVNYQHVHSTQIYAYDSAANAHLITWKTCPLNHTLCQKNSQTTQSLAKTASLKSRPTDADKKDAGDICIARNHNHYIWPQPPGVNGLGVVSVYLAPATCPAMDPMCEVTASPTSVDMLKVYDCMYSTSNATGCD